MADENNIDLGFLPVEAPTLPGEPYPTTTVTVSGITFTYPKDYTALGDAQNISNLAASNFHLVNFFYDRTGGKGSPGQVLISDASGVRWADVSSTSPPLQTIDILDEGTGIGTVSRIDFYDGNDPNNLVKAQISAGSSTVAQVYISDRWSLTGPEANLFRLSKIGIFNTSPVYDLDVNGNVGITSTLNVQKAVTFGSSLSVTGNVAFTTTTSSSNTTNGALTVSGGMGLGENLNVGGYLQIYSSTQSTNVNTGALIVDGGAGIEKNVNIGGTVRIYDTTQSTDKDSGALIIDGGIGVEKNANIGGSVTISGTTQSTNKDTGALIVEGGVGVEKNVNIGGNTKLTGTLELDSSLIDVNGSTASGKVDYRLASVGTGVSWRPPGVQTQNAIWVTMDGNDANSGLLEGDAKRTVGAAAAVAQEGDTIFIRSGVYYENNPIGLRTDVSVSGQDLRLVTIIPNNPTKDVFHVRRGCLVENLNFAGSSVSVAHTGCGAVAFPPTNPADYAVSGYIAPGPATEGSSGRWRSPYIRNCTNFMSKSIGMKIDGNHATASTLGANLKSMVCDSFTQYNENGIGVSISNNGYAQLVSIFTINCDIGIYCESGGSCDLTNSNSSFGNFGLVAVGLGSTEFTGKVNANTNPELDTITLKNVFDNASNPRRPYDGQALWFKINLSNYPDTVGVGTITAPLQELTSITVLNGGSGFSATSPPNVIIRDADGTLQPKGPQGIVAEASATVNNAGQITAIDVVSTGRNYLSTQNIVVDVEGNTGLATAVMAPIYYTVSEATAPTIAGVSTVTFNEFIPYELFENDPIELRRISRILTSSHSFEYIGTGTDINTSTPLQGAVPIKANEVVARDGAQIPFTSTDQKGNFDIGEGIQIDQTTSTIRGRDFSRAIQAEVTPLILALR